MKDVFVVNTSKDEAKVMKIAMRWANKGRIVRKCTMVHAANIKGREWEEPEVKRL